MDSKMLFDRTGKAGGQQRVSAEFKEILRTFNLPHTQQSLPKRSETCLHGLVFSQQRSDRYGRRKRIARNPQLADVENLAMDGIVKMMKQSFVTGFMALCTARPVARAVRRSRQNFNVVFLREVAKFRRSDRIAACSCGPSLFLLIFPVTNRPRFRFDG